MISWVYNNGPHHDKSNNVAVLDNEESDQPGTHLVWSVFAIHMGESLVFNIPVSARR